MDFGKTIFAGCSLLALLMESSVFVFAKQFPGAHLPLRSFHPNILWTVQTLLPITGNTGPVTTSG